MAATLMSTYSVPDLHIRFSFTYKQMLIQCLLSLSAKGSQEWMDRSLSSGSDKSSLLVSLPTKSYSFTHPSPPLVRMEGSVVQHSLCRERDIL